MARKARERLDGDGQTLCKYFKRAVTITTHPGRVPPYHAHPIPNTYVFVRCGAFQFYPFYWLCIFYSCLKFIHKYSDSAPAPSPPLPLYTLSLHTSNSNCRMACPIAILSHPIPSLTSPSHLLRFVCKLVYWNFLFAFCPVSSVCHPSPQPPLWRLLGCVHHLVKLRSYSICIPYTHIKSFSLFDLCFKE